MRQNSRRTAAFIVAKWLATKEFPSAMLPSGEDRAFVQDLVYTVVRRLRALRLVLGKLVRQWPKGELEALLYVGAAQVLYMGDVPDFAAVNETVSAAKECDNPSIPKVVNGVLRNLIRRRGEFEELVAKASLEDRESFPTAIVRRWRERFGEEGAARLCEWHNRPAETFLAYRDGRFEKLARGQRVEGVEGFSEGAFIVQDPGTALAVEAMGVQAGDKVLDACAAPGGKTVQLAWRGADVTACEVNPSRRRKLCENIARLGLGESVKVRDIGEMEADGSRETFAKVLVDAPCSNTGVFRRRPDARWNWSAEKLAALARLQGEILDRCAKFVAPGGCLVYSTCSNEPEENALQVDAFLARHAEFEKEGERESVPFESGHDGAYACRLRRKA
jgi:16S rRNA (cytosine967-C5)-methyltransferase